MLNYIFENWFWNYDVGQINIYISCLNWNIVRYVDIRFRRSERGKEEKFILLLFIFSRFLDLCVLQFFMRVCIRFLGRWDSVVFSGVKLGCKLGFLGVGDGGGLIFFIFFEIIRREYFF